MKHTEGPWIISEYEVRHPITLEIRKGCEIFCKDNNRVVCQIPDYHFHAEDVEYQSADSRLIAAAPELLEALEKLRQAFVIAAGDESPFCKFALDPVDAVIAKARGNN